MRLTLDFQALNLRFGTEVKDDKIVQDIPFAILAPWSESSRILLDLCAGSGLKDLDPPFLVEQVAIDPSPHGMGMLGQDGDMVELAMKARIHLILEG